MFPQFETKKHVYDMKSEGIILSTMHDKGCNSKQSKAKKNRLPIDHGLQIKGLLFFLCDNLE